MGIIRSYTKGFKHSIRSPKMILILYIVNFLAALILVMPFFQFLKSSSNHTIEVENLLKTFDFSFFTDIIYTSGEIFKSIFMQIKWVSLLYWLVNIFLVGGIIRVILKERFTVTDFFSGASTYFFRFLGSNITILIVHIFLLMIIWLPYFFIIRELFDVIDNEKTLIIVTACVLFVYLSLLVIVLMINDYAKFYLVLNNKKNFFKAILEATRYINKHFFKTYFLYILLLIVPFLVFYLYLKLSSDIGMATIFGVIVMFVVQQIFIFVKIWLKVWFYSSQFDLYTSDFMKTEKIKLREIVNNIEEKFTDLKEDFFEKEEE